MNREDRSVMDRYAYCLCLHVRPGTVFVGVVNMAGSLLCAIMYFGVLMFPQHQEELLHNDPGRSTAAALAGIFYLMCATVSGMLLYGVAKSRPSYIMPFFWIQLCDFFFSLPTFLASLYASPGYNAHWEQSHAAHGGLVKRFWPHNGPNSSLLVATCIIMFKGYFLCVVWKCYRYLKMKEMILPLHFPCTPSGIMVPPGFVPPSVLPVAITSMAPPDYETASKSSAAPPDYETAIRNSSKVILPEETPVAEPKPQTDDNSNSETASAAPETSGTETEQPRAQDGKQ